MYGGRITSEEKSSLSTYVGVAVAVLLTAGAVYFLFLTQKQKQDTFGFDPNRPIPSDAVLQGRLTARAIQRRATRGQRDAVPERLLE